MNQTLPTLNVEQHLNWWAVTVVSMSVALLFLLVFLLSFIFLRTKKDNNFTMICGLFFVAALSCGGFFMWKGFTMDPVVGNVGLGMEQYSTSVTDLQTWASDNYDMSVSSFDGKGGVKMKDDSGATQKCSIGFGHFEKNENASSFTSSVGKVDAGLICGGVYVKPVS